MARFLRTHVAEALLAREGIRRSMKPEDLQRLKEDVLRRLNAIEQEGARDRETVGCLFEDLVGKAVGSGTSALSVLIGLLERASDKGTGEGDQDGEGA